MKNIVIRNAKILQDTSHQDNTNFEIREQITINPKRVNSKCRYSKKYIRSVLELPKSTYLHGKYDGYPIAVYYINGKLHSIYSRIHNNELNLTQQLKLKVPEFIEKFKQNPLVVIDCEAVFDYSTYQEQSKSKVMSLFNHNPPNQKIINNYIHVIPINCSVGTNFSFLTQNNLSNNYIDDTTTVVDVYDMLGKFTRVMINGFVLDYKHIYKRTTSECKITKVFNISWGLSHTFKYIPYICVYPVTIEGRETSRCSTNLNYLTMNNINTDAIVSIKRSIAGVPYVYEVLTPSKIPVKLPTCDCGSQTIVCKDNVVCNNPNCIVYYWDIYNRFIDVYGNVPASKDIMHLHISDPELAMKKLRALHSNKSFRNLNDKQKRYVLYLSKGRPSVSLSGLSMKEVLTICSEDQKINLITNPGILKLLTILYGE